MKKTLRMMGLVALAVLALAGCKKDEQTTSSFKATLPQPTSDAKTHIGNGDSLLWNAGDAIKVFDTDGNAYLFTTDDGNKSTATFTGETSLNASNTYTAFYPAANTSDVTNGEILLTLAADQTYVAGGFANGTYPVVAQNEGASFTFDSDCGLLAIPVMGTGNISTIELTGKASENLAGQLRYDLSGHYLGLTNAQTTVTLDCGNLPLSADATTFYFVVPAGVFANGFTAVLKNGATELFTLATTNPNTIVAKRIRQMNPVTVSAITLVTGGGTPANVGYTDATVYGSYVAPTGMGVTEIGFYFGTDASAMTATPVTPIASPFSHTFDGLTAGTTYYYQAYAKNGTNEYLGTVESFTTNVPAATVTTAPTATTGTIYAGSTTPLVSAGVAEGGTMMYMVTTENTKPTSTTGFSATVPTAETLASGTYYVWYYVQGDATHTDSEISATGIEVTIEAAGPPALTMEALTAGNIQVNIGGTLSTGMKYSVNGGAKTTIYETTTIPVNAGDKVRFYGNGTSTQVYGFMTAVKLQGTAQTKVYGNIMSLLDEDNFATLTALPDEMNVFTGLFKDNVNLTDASGLLLPATTLAYGCYQNMFNGCSSLTAAPALPATTLPGGGYAGMFTGCTSLTTAPTTLPATTLKDFCYYEMFKGCSSLTAAPVLPATTLVSFCYQNMFQNCSNLNSVTCLATNISASSCTANWLDGVAPTGTFTKASGVNWTLNSSSGIPSGWTVTVAGGGDEHAYVDLGLPSGLLWATCNIGANAPEEYGDYFAWGETTTKTTYNWSTYQYCNGSYNTLTKYCNKANYGYNGFTDDLTTLQLSDDAARANWGSDWRMPTKAEFQELLDYTNMTWTQQGGVNGWLFTATDDSGNSLFLPAAGYRCDGGLNEAGEYGYYWSSSRDSYYPNYASYFLFGLYYGSDYCDIGSYDRGEGRTVRPVRNAE